MVPFGYTPGGGATPPSTVPTITGSAIRHLGTLNWVRFAIRPENGTIPPALTMERLDQPGSAAQVLADGIEDLQVAFGCDNDSDGALPDGPNKAIDEWELNTDVPETPPAINCSRPAAIRLTLVARSLTPDSLLKSMTSNARPIVENRTTAGPQDQFRHRVLTTTIFPRNLLGVP
jgi:hypothetical protein